MWFSQHSSVRSAVANRRIKQSIVVHVHDGVGVMVQDVGIGVP